MYEWFAYKYVCACPEPTEAKRGSDPSGLQLSELVSSYMGTGHQTQSSARATLLYTTEYLPSKGIFLKKKKLGKIADSSSEL